MVSSRLVKVRKDDLLTRSDLLTISVNARCREDFAVLLIFKIIISSVMQLVFVESFSSYYNSLAVLVDNRPSVDERHPTDVHILDGYLLGLSAISSGHKSTAPKAIYNETDSSSDKGKSSLATLFHRNLLPFLLVFSPGRSPNDGRKQPGLHGMGTSSTRLLSACRDGRAAASKVFNIEFS